MGRETLATSQPRPRNPVTDISRLSSLRLVMLKSLNTPKNILAISLLLVNAPAMATALGSADMFNAYSLGTFNYGSVDIEGVIGAGGDITYTGGDTGRYAPSDAEYTIYGEKNVTVTNHHVYNGGIQAGGTISTTDTTLGGNIGANKDVNITRGSFSSASPTITSEQNVTLTGLAVQNGTVHVGGVFDNEAGGNFTGSTLVLGPTASTTADQWYLNQGTVIAGSNPEVTLIDHQQIANDIISASQSYASQDANANTINLGNQEWLFEGTSDLNIFDFTGSDLANLASLSFTGDASATYIINVEGSDISFGLVDHLIGGFFFNGEQMSVDTHDDISSRILFNFFEANTLDIYGSVFGTILAPYADVYYVNGAINGSVYAGSLSGDGQINAISFNGEGVTPPSQVPVPATWLLMLCGLLWMKQRTS